MQVDTLENALFPISVNPLLKSIIRRFDRECPKDGNLLINSLKSYLGESLELCPECERINRKVAKHFYDLGTLMFDMNPKFMRHQFLGSRYGEAWLRGFGLMMKGIEKNGITVPFTPAGPFEIVWNVTYQCNLKCTHCYENAGASKRRELSTEEAKLVLDKMSKLSGIGLPAVSFSGGEPLARKDVFDLLAHAKKRICYVSIASNGTLITKDNAKRLKDIGVDYAEISVDGATSAVHDGFRGISGAFDRTMLGVSNCLEEGIDVCIATVVHKNNLSELSQLVSLANKLGTRLMHFNYIPTGRAKAHVELDLSPDERLSVLRTLGKELVGLYLQSKQEELFHGKSKTLVDRFFSTCPQYASVTKELSQEHGEEFIVEAHYAAKQGVETVANFLGGCGAGRLYCCLEPNGDIKPCVFFPTKKENILGNILIDDFEEIWDTNPLLWRVRNRERLQDYIIDGKTVGCAHCDDKYICGGCRARAYSYFDGCVEAPDIGCIHNKPLWEKIANQQKSGRSREGLSY